MNTEWIDQFSMLPEGTKVLVALSGGRDSVYLLYRLLELAPSRTLTIGAAHYNHHLRGTESLRDAQFVKDLCGELQIPLYTGDGNVEQYAKDHKLGIESAARELRYAFLEQMRSTHGYDVVATAHQANDQAETMLLNLARGTGTHGLAGIPPVRDRIIRPILDISRTEISQYLERRKIPFVEDSSNAQEICGRNLLRLRVLPELERLNPQFVQHAGEAALALRADDTCLEQWADRFLTEQKRTDSLDARELAALPEPVAYRVLRRMCGGMLSRQHVGQIMALCDGTAYRETCISGRKVRYDQGRLYFREEDSPKIEPRLLPLDGTAVQCGSIQIVCTVQEYPTDIYNSFTKFCLNYEKIKSTLFVTPRQDGDCVCLAGPNCTKALKDLFREGKIPVARRDSVPVFRDEEGIVAVYGFGIAQRCVPEIGEKVICIECKEYTEIGGKRHEYDR